MMGRPSASLVSSRRAFGAAALATALLVVSATAPEPAHAILGIPGPEEIVGQVFEFFFKTFFGIEADITRRAVQFLVALPVYSDAARYPELGQLRSAIEVAAWGLLTLVFCVAGVRYYVSGFTSSGSFEAIQTMGRGALAAGMLVVYPELFGYLSVAVNHLTYGLTHAPGVEDGLTKALAGATTASFTPLGIGAIAAVIAVVMLLLLIVTKVVLATLLAVLFVAAPFAIALWPLPETSWLSRTCLQGLLGVLLWPVMWTLCFAVFAVMGKAAFTFSGDFGDELVKPWVSVAALLCAWKIPQLLARQAMLAGLTPSLGGGIRTAMVYGRSATGQLAQRGVSRGAEGVSGRFGAARAGGAVGG
jgi:hypothetical protein